MCNKLSFIIITKALKFWLQTEILSAHNRSSQITWVSLVRLQHHSIFSAWQTSFHRHQTLQAPDSIKPMVFYHPPCISIHSPPCWKHLETYSLCCWLVLLQVSPQPIPQAHPVFQKRVLLQPCNFSLRQPQTSLANSQQTPTPANPPHRYPPLFLPLHLQTALLLFFILTPSFSQQQPWYIISSSPATPPNFSVFTPASESEIYQILYNCPNKQSDPILTWLVKECSSVLVSVITNIVNLSLTSGHFCPTLKESLCLHNAEETHFG